METPAVEKEKGLVFDIHRGTTHDGPGLRTTVFMKGCPLRCGWCHNPEGLNPKEESRWISRRCIGCRTCLAVCPGEALTFEEAGLRINKEACIECRQCVQRCPAGAQTLSGKRWPAEALAAEALKDALFFEEFEGGVTVSGGEPLMQAGFVEEFLRILKAKGANTALDTSGFASREAFERVEPFADVFLYDLKFIDGKLHRKHTGVDNRLILDNFRWLLEKIEDSSGKRIRVRTPLVPGATATEENIAQIGDFLQNVSNEKVERWELCAFNSVSRDKYAGMGLDWAYSSVPLMKQKEIDALLQTAKKRFGNQVFATGLAAKEEEIT
jgi:pyruvate formate lyase activating enzyme